MDEEARIIEEESKGSQEILGVIENPSLLDYDKDPGTDQNEAALAYQKYSNPSIALVIEEESKVPLR